MSHTYSKYEFMGSDSAVRSSFRSVQVLRAFGYSYVPVPYCNLYVSTDSSVGNLPIAISVKTFLFLPDIVYL
eukprot:COSAG02_NODE_2826_length_7942_cov_6.674869_1_plen_72_part_00